MESKLYDIPATDSRDYGGLNINTPRGQKTVEDAERAIDLFESYYPEFAFVGTPADTGAELDGVVYKSMGKASTGSGAVVAAVAELKCRYGVDETVLYGKFAGEWLLSYSKVKALQIAAKILGVPGLGLLYLPDSDGPLLLVRWICNREGILFDGIRVKETRTQKNVNGGTAVRENAFINLRMYTTVIG